DYYCQSYDSSMSVWVF
nr:immunoglobulin light chain junction region [Macaca mulatta]